MSFIDSLEREARLSRIQSQVVTVELLFKDFEDWGLVNVQSHDQPEQHALLLDYNVGPI